METDLFTLAALADEAFLSLGTDEIVYLKTIDVDGVRETGIYSADGTPITTAPSIAIAQEMVRDHGLQPALVH